MTKEVSREVLWETYFVACRCNHCGFRMNKEKSRHNNGVCRKCGHYSGKKEWDATTYRGRIACYLVHKRFLGLIPYSVELTEFEELEVLK